MKKNLLFILLFGSWFKQTIQTTDFPLDLPQIEKCQKIFLGEGGKKLMTLEGAVGIGIDTLVTEPRAAVFDGSFHECKTTPDSNYLVPDGLLAVPIQQTKFTRVSEYYETFESYEQTTKDSIVNNAHVSFFGFADIAGKYSRERTERITQMYQHNTSIFHSFLKYESCELIVPSDNNLHPQFKKRMEEVLNLLESGVSSMISLQVNGTAITNDTGLISYLCGLIVRDYGTHFVNRALMGAQMTQVDFVDMTTKEGSQLKIDDAKKAAALTFTSKFINFSGDTSSEHYVSEETRRRFFEAKHRTELKMKGGPNVNQVIGNADLTIDYIVPLNRDGKPLYYLITPANFPGYRPETVRKAAEELELAIKEYFAWNRRPGCMKPQAENYDINANVEDETCHFSPNNLTFAGVFQYCSYPYVGCPYNQINGITGGYSCPAPYEAHRLLQVNTVHNVCERSCDSCWLVFTCCDDECHMEGFAFSTYWCKYPEDQHPPLDSGYLFGGLYSNVAPNPYTGSKSCPGHFVEVNFALDVKICLSRQWDLDEQYSIIMRHMFSCQSPESEKRCPFGYNQRLATVVYGCEIYYCISPSHKNKQKIMDVIQPPYGRKMLQYSPPKATYTGLGTSTIVLIVLLSIVLPLVIAVVVIIIVKKYRRPVNAPVPLRDEPGASYSPIINDVQQE